MTPEKSSLSAGVIDQIRQIPYLRERVLAEAIPL